MKTATLRDLRYDFGQLEAWVKAGERISITRHGRPVFDIVPPAKPAAKKIVLPDFAARRKQIWGGRVFSQEEIERMRAEETGEP